MLSVRFDPPAAKYIKKLKDKKLKALYQKAVDAICEDYTIGSPKTGDLAGFYGYDIYYNKTNYENWHIPLKELMGNSQLSLWLEHRKGFFYIYERFRIRSNVYICNSFVETVINSV